MINILNMNFPDSTNLNIGSIKFDRFGENLHLLGVDVGKLNLLTRAVCVGAFNADVFAFQSGDIAFTDDTQRAFVYNSDSDSWHEWEI